MPRVSLTASQKEAAKEKLQEERLNALFQCVVDGMKIKQSLLNYNDDQFSKIIGVSTNTWRRWRGDVGVGSASFGAVVLAAVRCGVSFEAKPPEVKQVLLKGE